MKEVFEKIIEKLDEYEYENLVEHDSEQSQHCKDAGDCKGMDCSLCVFNKAIEIVKQEAEQYNNGWIPCSERLPEKPRENPKLEGRYVELYLVVEKESDYPFRAFWNGKSFTDGMFPLDVIAWQPLPQPYTKGE